MKIVPLGDRIIVVRQVVGDKIGKAGIILTTDHLANAPTDLATIVSIPDSSFADEQILNGSEETIQALQKKANEGDSNALIALLKLNDYIKIKSIQPGDKVMISRNVGITFNTSEDTTKNLCVVRTDDIIAVIYDR